MRLKAVLAKAEVVADFASASKARLEEAEKLYQSSDYVGATYLAGFSAEMALKLAFYRLGPRVHQFTSLESSQEFYFVMKKAQQLKTMTNYKSGHGIIWWGELLIDNKVRRSSFDDLILRRCRTLEARWDVKLRYRDQSLIAREARLVLSSARWLVDRQSRLHK